MIILPLAKQIAEFGDLRVYKERSLAEWVRDQLPEGATFTITHFDVNGDEAQATVNVRLPPSAQRVDIRIESVDP